MKQKSLTEKQTLVLEKLSAANEPMSAYALLDDLRDDGFRAPLQVYRALDKLIESGHVHKLESLNAYLACQHHDCHSDHDASAFTICDECGQVSEVLNEKLIKTIIALSQQTGFAVNQTTLELKGICADCKSGHDKRA